MLLETLNLIKWTSLVTRGKAFFPQELGVPNYEELIFIINIKNRNEIKFKKFLQAIQKATIKIVNNPNKTWNDFSKYRNGLNDELNKRAYRDTIKRFSLRPNAYDLDAYQKFQQFLYKQKIIKKFMILNYLLNRDYIFFNYD